MKLYEDLYNENNISAVSGICVNGLPVHDSSAKAVSADSTRASDGTPSGITAPQALKTINNNYSICKENSDRLASLQNWIREQEKLTRLSNAK